MNNLFTFCIVVLVITGIYVTLKEQKTANNIMIKSTYAPLFSLSERVWSIKAPSFNNSCVKEVSYCTLIIAVSL